MRIKNPLLIIAILATGFLLALAGALVVRSLHDKNHVVLNGPSMEPTLYDGQTLTITKYAQGSNPQRNDIVEYSIPKSSSQYSKYPNQKLLHRIIGMPGERVTVSNGQVLVFNKEHPQGFNPDTALRLQGITSGDLDVTLAPDTYFMLGDNRPNALDSRTLGPIPISSIIAKVKMDH